MASRHFSVRVFRIRLVAFAVALTLIAALGLVSVAGPAGAASVPGVPTQVTASAGNAQATVSWVAPGSNGGSPITGYAVTSIPGGGTATASGTVTSATVTGLTNGTSYRFVVTAANAVGTSAPSASSEPVTPAAVQVPDAPVITNVTGRNGAIQVSWSPPDTGSGNLTGYVITVFSGGSTVKTVSAKASATKAVVGGLTNGTDYRFTVTAANAAGSGPASPESVAVAPRPATAPMAPGDVQVIRQNGQVQVAWVAPPDGGSAITGYTVSVSPATVAPVTTGPGTTVTTVTGLTNGTAYTVSVTASNAVGAGPAATAGPVTPAASIVPGVPGNLSAVTSAAGSVEFEWVPPVNPGTSAITSYTATATTGGSTAATQAFPASDCTGSPVLCTGIMSGLTSTTAYTFTMKAANSAGTSKATAATNAVTPNVVVKKAPVLLSSASVASLRRIGTDGTLYFERPPAQVTGLKAGNLLKISPGSAAQNGFLGTVKTVATQAGLVVVTTSRATLADEYSSYGASLNIPVNSASIKPANVVPGVTLASPTLQDVPVSGSPSSADPGAASGTGISWTNGSLVLSVDTDLLQGDSPQGENATVTQGPVAHIQGTITITPHISGSIAIPDVAVRVSADVNADLTAQLGVQLGVSKIIPLGEFGDDAIETPLGPQDLTFTIDAILNTNGTVGVSFEAGYHETLGATCTINFVTANAPEDACQKIQQDNGSGLTTKSQLYGSMSIQAGVQFGVTWEIEDVAGPGLTLTPWVRATVDTRANPWEDISVGASLGADFEALDDCMLFVCFPGVTLFSSPNLINGTLLDIWNSGGPFQGLSLSPNVARLGKGQSVTFTATTPAGTIAGSSVTWTVLTGPGTIDSSGTFTASGNGIAVIEADFNGSTARAGLVIQSALSAPAVDSLSRGLIGAVLASWEPTATNVASYTVTARAATPLPAGTSANSGESVVVLAPATYAYLPDLEPGVTYSVTVSAVSSDGRSVAAAPDILTPLEPLPGALAGTGVLQDVTSLGQSFPDKVGSAGQGGIGMSADGSYAFYAVEARSPLAPTSIFDPAGLDDFFLVRQSLHAPSVIDLASVAPDGTPATIGPGQYGGFTTNSNGSAVVFGAPDLGSVFVHDFVTNTSWAIGPPAGYTIDSTWGLADDGTVLFTATSGNVTHVYLQPMNGAPKQIDKCVADTTGNACRTASMSSDGNLVVYGGPLASGAVTTTYLYNATTGSNINLFPSNTTAGSDVDSAVISADGSHVAAEYAAGGNPAFSGLVVEPFTGATITIQNSDILVSDANSSVSDQAVGVSDDGSVLAYVTAAPDFHIYKGGATINAPSLSGYFGCSGSLSADGSEFLYGLCFTNSLAAPFGNYPGVYEWQIP